MSEQNKLVKIVHHQIQKKRLGQGIRHTEMRNKYRSCKLAENYSIPNSSPRRVYLYSNLDGNQFILNHEDYKVTQFRQKQHLLLIIEEILKSVNLSLYNIWVKKKEFNSQTYFPNHEYALRTVFKIIAILFLVIYPIWPISRALMPIELVQKWLYKTILLIIASIIVVCGFFLGKTMCTSYKVFDFDNEAINKVADLLSEYEEKLAQLSIGIECDRQLTWICFAELSESGDKSSMCSEDIKQEKLSKVEEQDQSCMANADIDISEENQQNRKV